MVKQDHLEGFEHTKEAFYVHVKVLWGLISKGSIPMAPSEQQLRSFYQRFRNTDKIESAIEKGPNLAAIELQAKRCGDLIGKGTEEARANQAGGAPGGPEVAQWGGLRSKEDAGAVELG
ncbi:hypothetical protein VP01_1649g7 [Puccinia sorghi]|uniref:Uncharacterized protein n=1 Tax=Puccinia sorghi TaxID=27349 RepID=A0A0L6VGP5_9BASI|nr:hypothetical protein VP01_1649g7 [Puccinia sorghi]